MPERVEKLRATLAELEQELRSLESLDPQARQLLQEAVEDINAALQQEQAETIQQESLVERLSESAQQFESSHPTLFRVVGNIVDALGQLGI